MSYAFTSELPLLWDSAWQASLWLLAGLGGSLLWARRSARAHRVLLLALTAALVSPLLSQAARLQGWGLWQSPAPATEEVATVATGLTGDQAVATEPGPRAELPVRLLDRLTPAAAGPQAEPDVAPASTPEAAPPEAAPFVSVTGVFLGAWALLTGLLVLRFLASAFRGWRLVARSRPLTGARLGTALQQALARLGERGDLRIHTSDEVQCPMIWCWGRRPVLLLPQAAAARPASVDWVSILSHELAHWKRRDHLSGLLSECGVLLLPWHPLTWWTRRRLGQLSEQACDDWVLASGQSPVLYAEALLGLLPQWRTHLALAAVGSRTNLVSRVRHILSECRPNPVVGRAWTLAAVLLTAVLATGMALAQARPSDAMKLPGVASSPADGGPLRSLVAEHIIILGQVHGGAGKPLSAAQVVLLVRPQSVPGQRWPNRWQEAAAGKTDASGQFRLQVPRSLVVRASEAWVAAGQTGSGLGWKSLDLAKLSDVGVIKLHPEQVLHGRLVDLQGQAAAGLQVRVRRVWLGGEDAPERNRVSEPEDRSALWPRPATTDDHGRFAVYGLDGLVGGTLEVRDDRFAPQELEFGPRAAKPGDDLSLALSPARFLEGRLSAEDTGKPLAHARLTAWGYQGRVTTAVYAETDAEGRYRLNLSPGRQFAVFAFAPVGGPYFSKYLNQEWPKGRQRHVLDLTLPRGIPIRGKVTDDTGQPVARAVVQYYARENGLPQRFSLFSGSGGTGGQLGGVVAGPDGAYQIPAHAGAGTLLVSAPQPGYVGVEVSEGYLFSGMDSPGGTVIVVNQFVPVRLKKGEDGHLVDVRLRRTVTFHGRLLGPDGKAVAEARLFSRRQEAPSYNLHLVTGVRQVSGGRFEVPGVNPDATYRMFFLDTRNLAGAFVELSGKQAAQPQTVRLGPCGSAVARLRDAAGKPLADAWLTLSLVVTPRSGFLDTLVGGRTQDGTALLAADLDPVHYRQQLLTDARGECVLPALIPGVTYRLTSNWGEVQEFTVKPGENRILPYARLPGTR